MSTWKAIPGWEGIYEVSDDGLVRVLDRRVTFRSSSRLVPGRLLRQRSSGSYRAVTLRSRDRQKAVNVHRLMGLAFLGSPPELRAEVRHLDGDGCNNHLSNLAWGSRTDQRADDRRNGVMAWGERARHAKLTAEQVLTIRRRLKQGEYQHMLAHEFGVTGSAISFIKTRRTWAHLPEEG